MDPIFSNLANNTASALLNRPMQGHSFMPNLSPPSGRDFSSFAMQREDTLDLSADARATYAAIRSAEDDATAIIQDFAANFSASFQSQSMTQINRIAGDNALGINALSQTSFKINIDVSASSASLQTGDMDPEGIIDAKMKDYLLLLKSLLKDMRGEMQNFFKDSSNWLAGDGSLDVDKINEFINDLSNTLQNLMPEAVGGNAVGISRTLQNLKIDIHVTAEQTQQIDITRQAIDPLVLDVNGDGVTLTSAIKGMRFDIDANGILEQMATVMQGDAFLAWDRNDNGKIDNGKELFGNQHGAKHGFEELKRYDNNRDGVIDRKDPIFSSLLLYSDRNRDGISQPEDIQSLSAAGIKSISLRYMDTELSSSGNRISQVGSFTRDDGTTGQTADAWLNYVM